MSFLAPLILIGLVGLPLIVWLLRAMPPRPIKQVFGGMFFLEKLDSPKQKPVRTPPLILLLRLLAFTAFVAGLAGPRLGQPAEPVDGPLLLAVENDWAAAQRWDDRISAAEAVLETTSGTVRVLETTTGTLSEPLNRAAAIAHLRTLKPQAVRTDWASVTEAFNAWEGRRVMIASGLAPEEGEDASSLRLASVHFPEGSVLALTDVQLTADQITVTAKRSLGGAERSLRVRALSRDGRTLATESLRFDAGAEEAETSFRLPILLRNDIARIDIEGVPSAGTVRLLGASARRTLAGIVSSGTETLSEGGFYIVRALSPSAEMIEGPIASVLERSPGLVVLDDVGTLRDADRTRLERFVRGGGVLLRFSGPNLLAGESRLDDPLLTAPLLGGERALGGALTWAEPQEVASIDPGSPLMGLSLSEKISVRRQVLTQPASSAEAWVSLEDGTPLVTARRVGSGMVILIHVSAAPTWSDLPVSGFFAAMMQRLAAFTETTLEAPTQQPGEALPAQFLLGGRGDLFDAPPQSAPLEVGGPRALPGLYGRGTAETAVNAVQPGDDVRTFNAGNVPRGTRVLQLEVGASRDLSALFLIAALLMLTVDGVVTLGRSAQGPRTVAAAAVLIMAALFTAPEAEAQIRPPLSREASDAALGIRFAHIRTGDARLDRLAGQGLSGLSRTAYQRSSLEPGTPHMVDPDRDELSIYPLLYWPLRAGQTPLSDSALQRLEDFMDGGGMLIIDTADGANPGQSTVLRDLLGRLDLPVLEPLAEDNVLLFSFYRLDDLHGRNSAGRVWVEARGALQQRRDGVPSLIISGRDWASAWALDEGGVPLRPAGPGGEARREYAFRAGINIAMVAITGNYKADQADVQEMLNALGKDDDNGR